MLYQVTVDTAVISEHQNNSITRKMCEVLGRIVRVKQILGEISCCLLPCYYLVLYLFSVLLTVHSPCLGISSSHLQSLAEMSFHSR